MFKRLGAAILLVEDLQKSIAFYRDTLELEIKNQSQDWVEFEKEGQSAVLALHPARIKRKGFSNMLVGFSVSNLESECKKLEGKMSSSTKSYPRNPSENMQLLRTLMVTSYLL